MKNLLNKTPTLITSTKIIQTKKHKKSKSTTKLKKQKQNHQLTPRSIIANQTNKIFNFSPNQKKNFYFLQKKQIKRH